MALGRLPFMFLCWQLRYLFSCGLGSTGSIGKMRSAYERGLVQGRKLARERLMLSGLVNIHPAMRATRLAGRPSLRRAARVELFDSRECRIPGFLMIIINNNNHHDTALPHLTRAYLMCDNGLMTISELGASLIPHHPFIVCF